MNLRVHLRSDLCSPGKGYYRTGLGTQQPRWTRNREALEALELGTQAELALRMESSSPASWRYIKILRRGGYARLARGFGEKRS